MLSDNDLEFIKQHGISQKQIEDQLSRFKKGYPNLNIIKPAGNRDGIKKLSDKQLDQFVRIYNKAPRRLKRLKFVPASGAASRMFKSLYKIVQNNKGTEEEYLELMADKGFDSVYYMLQNLKCFAFYNDLVEVIEKNGSSINEISKNKNFSFLLDNLLEEQGLNYGNLPKGLLKFHRTFENERTPVHEHLIEGVYYAASGRNVNLHFTVSEEHMSMFKEHLEKLVPKLQKEFKIKYHISFSIQNPSTDTVAIDSENNLVRNADGEIQFRPGGHGALIHNLNAIDADLIFIKNIDNVVQDRMKEDTYLYKSALAGILISLKTKAAEYYKKLGKKVNDELIIEIGEFLRKKLFVIPPMGYCEWESSKKIEFLKSKLNRPIRVCGMVANEGEPGGGPFWVEAADGSKSLQIIETIQFAENQKGILGKSTYFNPVDIVCSTKGFDGKKFNLLKFVDQETGLISKKSMNGKEILALELPGLWNGAMANWNSIFVEVPVSTFNPVKTINDLLRTEHMFENDLLKENKNHQNIIV